MFYIKSRFGESTGIGRTQVLRVTTNIKELIERAKIQAVFKHLNDELGDPKSDTPGWQRFYNDSDKVVQDSKRVKNLSDDVGDDIEVKLIDYIFEYPKFGSRIKYKTINVKGKRYIQTFRRSGNRYVFDERFKISGRAKNTRRMVQDV